MENSMEKTAACSQDIYAHFDVMLMLVRKFASNFWRLSLADVRAFSFIHSHCSWGGSLAHRFTHRDLRLCKIQTHWLVAKMFFARFDVNLKLMQQLFSTFWRFSRYWCNSVLIRALPSQLRGSSTLSFHSPRTKFIEYANTPTCS